MTPSYEDCGHGGAQEARDFTPRWIQSLLQDGWRVYSKMDEFTPRYTSYSPCPPCQVRVVSSPKKDLSVQEKRSVSSETVLFLWQLPCPLEGAEAGVERELTYEHRRNGQRPRRKQETCPHRCFAEGCANHCVPPEARGRGDNGGDGTSSCSNV